MEELMDLASIAFMRTKNRVSKAEIPLMILIHIIVSRKWLFYIYIYLTKIMHQVIVKFNTDHH